MSDKLTFDEFKAKFIKVDPTLVAEGSAIHGVDLWPVVDEAIQVEYDRYLNDD